MSSNIYIFVKTLSKLEILKHIISFLLKRKEKQRRDVLKKKKKIYICLISVTEKVYIE